MERQRWIRNQLMVVGILMDHASSPHHLPVDLTDGLMLSSVLLLVSQQWLISGQHQQSQQSQQTSKQNQQTTEQHNVQKR
jgi:hypothetical protein